jgi:hypothetical protein
MKKNDWSEYNILNNFRILSGVTWKWQNKNFLFRTTLFEDLNGRSRWMRNLSEQIREMADKGMTPDEIAEKIDTEVSISIASIAGATILATTS